MQHIKAMKIGLLVVSASQEQLVILDFCTMFWCLFLFFN